MRPIQDSRGCRRRVIRTEGVENGHLHRAGDIRLRAYVNAIAAVGRLCRDHSPDRWFRDPFPPTWHTTPSHPLHTQETAAEDLSVAEL